MAPRTRDEADGSVEALEPEEAGGSPAVQSPDDETGVSWGPGGPDGPSRGTDLLSRPGARRTLWTVGILVGLTLLFQFGLTQVSLAEVIANGGQRGAIFALVGLGIALVYKATRVLNFAQGELGTVPAFLVFVLGTGFDLSDTATASASSLWWSSIVAVLAGILLAVLINVLVVQRLAEASPVTSLVATVGVALLLVQAEIIIFEAKGRRFPRFVDGGPPALDIGPWCLGREQSVDGVVQCTGNFAIGGIAVPWHTFIIVAVLAIMAVLLAILFRTPVGVALLATAQEPFAAELQGVSVRAMATLAWGTAGALGAVAGILGAGVFESLTPGLMTGTFLVPAFVGALLGGITSMPGAVVGGLIVGLVNAFANALNLGYDLGIPGPPVLATFIVLLVVLLLRPRGLLGKEA